MKKCVIIYNPKSGRARKKIENSALKEIALKYDYELSFVRTRRNGDASEIVKKLKLSEVDLVIAAGGDGTLHEVVEGNMQRKERVVMSHLPQGTVNDVGKMYGLTKNVTTDLEMLLQGKVKKIDTCLINNNPFVYVACFGNLVSVSFDTPRDLKEKYGKLGYIIYGAKKVRRSVKMYDIRYTVNGETKEDSFSFIFVSNTDRIAGVGNIFNDVKLDDNKFEVVLCKASTIQGCVQDMKNIVFHDASKLKNSIYFRTDKLDIEFLHSQRESWCLDGEELKIHKRKCSFTIDQDCEMLVPTKNIGKLFEN